jgi:hypothetical protein
MTSPDDQSHCYHDHLPSRIFSLFVPISTFALIRFKNGVSGMLEADSHRHSPRYPIDVEKVLGILFV